MDMSNNSLQTRDLSATITGLQQRTEYGIQVRAKTQRGWGAYSPAIFKTTGQVLNTGKKIKYFQLPTTESHCYITSINHCSLYW